MSTIYPKGRQRHQTQVTKWWLKHGKKEGEKVTQYTCWCKNIKPRVKGYMRHQKTDTDLPESLQEEPSPTI